MEPESPAPYREQRPWGEFVEFTRNKECTVKIITVKAGEAFSLQKHSERAEFWYVIAGSGTITVGKNRLPVAADQTYWIPRDTEHRLEANLELSVLEISFGNFREDDIIRLDDKYGRV